ncbi:alpha/beta fold hydrolase [Siccirubricoccus sp. G192]|uniref:alpha/beta fold hydrolase n=1 Tax=Siccirubricoccus sp. G192 TaxID=2849651 RepID=UPI001C2C9B14|nr:alpha/beta fold hydrolase [Siccirubricoccus sp. G192]MBV1797677.1 alpha/beta fold hydrolase [Siccirubricoccus sp. G192]
MARPETHYARSGGVHVAYQVHGSGTTDLVYIPGIISNLDVQWEEPGFARLLGRLGAFSRLVLFDKRGTGLSDPVAEAPSLETRMDDVRAVMDAAGMQQAFLLGTSEGGPLSMLFAAAYPERTRGLILYGTYACFHTAVLLPEQLEDFIRRIEAGWGSGASLQYFAPGRANDLAFREWWARFESLGASPDTMVRLARMCAPVDLRHLLPAIGVPTLVLHRAGDVRVKVAAGRELAACIPGARYAELPGTDHPLFTGDLDAAVDEIEEFITGLRPAPSVTLGRVLATVLAAEVADAERVAGALGDDGWHERMERWRSLTAAAVARFQGRPLGLMRADGAWLAGFDGPARAVRCGMALRQAAEAALDGCMLRCGVHTGEITPPKGNEDLGGLAVNLALHIAALARPGEVLVTGTVRDLAAGSGLRFREREQRLALPREAGGTQLRLFALAGDDRQTAPAEAHAHPLSARLSSLSAREREILRLVARGLSNSAIAADRALSEHTVKRHVANILTKLGLPTRAAAAALAARADII